MSYARGLLGLLILVAVVFFLLKVAIAGAIFGVLALILLVVVLVKGV